MPVEKLSISLPAPLAGRIDALAEEAGISRSALIQEAAAEYVASRDAVDAERARRGQVGAALTGFDEIADAWGADDRPGLQYLDDLREGAGAEPPVEDRGRA